MSKISIKPITCPKCKYSGEFKMYDSVNVSLDPDLRDEVLNGHIFEWVCPQCGEILSIRYDILYHDMDKEFQIYYSPTNCIGINKMINDMLTKYPGMRKLCRTVESLNALREKIYIFENGFNDIVIELAKILIKFDKQNNVPETCELRFERFIPTEKDSSKGQLVFRQFIEGKLQEGIVLFDMINYENYLQEIKTDKRFKMSQYCETINEKWLMERLK
jgi:hypothetical protein